MNEKTALKILIANVISNHNDLYCENCPINNENCFLECNNNNLVKEAVKVLNKSKGNNI